MSKTDQYSRRIANYLYKDLESQERLAFESDLRVDPDLAFEFKRQSEMVDYFKSRAVLDEMENSSDMDEAERLVKEFYASENKELAQEHPAADSDAGRDNRSIRRILYPLVAAAAVLVGILIFRSESPATTCTHLYSAYYEPLEDVNFTLRGAEKSEYGGFQDALDQYLNGAYTHSSRSLALVVAEYPGLAEAHFYYGLSLMGEEQYAASAELFESFLSEYDKYEAEVKWYLGLCYLKLERIPDAWELMSELAHQEGKLGKDAAKILKRLSPYV